MGIPNAAFPYLALKDLTPVVPEVYDAWVDNEIEVIILPDRHHWQEIPDLLINHSLVTTPDTERSTVTVRASPSLERQRELP